jgi:hypothetical protein
MPTILFILPYLVSQSLDLQAISYQQGILVNQWPGAENEQNFFLGVKASLVSEVGKSSSREL